MVVHAVHFSAGSLARPDVSSVSRPEPRLSFEELLEGFRPSAKFWSTKILLSLGFMRLDWHRSSRSLESLKLWSGGVLEGSLRAQVFGAACGIVAWFRTLPMCFLAPSKGDTRWGGGHPRRNMEVGKS